MNSTESHWWHKLRTEARRTTVTCFWAIIILKSVLVHWAIERYDIPVHPFWVVIPTLILAGVATYFFLQGEDGEDAG